MHGVCLLGGKDAVTVCDDADLAQVDFPAVVPHNVTGNVDVYKASHEGRVHAHVGSCLA